MPMEALRRYLDEKNITQSQFAKDLGVSQPTVSDWVNGIVTPSVPSLKGIAEKTGIPIAELVSAA